MSERRPSRVVVNRHLFTTSSVDSGALTMLGVVAHRFSEPGEYMGVVEGGREPRSFRFVVDEDAPAMQVDVDLATLGAGSSADCGCERTSSEPGGRFAVNPRGYVLFHVSSGAGGYRVRVGRGLDEIVFDSGRLEGEDVFAVTLIRAGTYSVRNVATDATAEIVVARARRRGGEGRTPLEPVTIECTEKGFRPAKIRIQPAQGQVYRFRTPSRIVIELVAPEAPGAEGPPRPRRSVRPPHRRS